MRTIRKGVVIPIGNELSGVRELVSAVGELVRVESWLYPVTYALKLGFFVMFVMPPAALFWMAYIAAKGDVDYLMSQAAVMLQNTNSIELTAATTSAYCIVALFGLLFVGLYVLMFPYRRSTSYIVSNYKDAAGNERNTRVPARGDR